MLIFVWLVRCAYGNRRFLGGCEMWKVRSGRGVRGKQEGREGMDRDGAMAWLYK